MSQELLLNKMQERTPHICYVPLLSVLLRVALYNAERRSKELSAWLLQATRSQPRMTYIAACQKERLEAWHGGEKIQQHEKGVHRKQPGTITYAIEEKPMFMLPNIANSPSHQRHRL